MKIICSSVDALPDSLPSGALVFTFLESSSQPGIGRIAHGWLRELKGKVMPRRFQCGILYFFALLSMRLMSVLRKESADGWTRQIELDITQ